MPTASLQAIQGFLAEVPTQLAAGELSGAPEGAPTPAPPMQRPPTPSPTITPTTEWVWTALFAAYTVAVIVTVVLALVVRRRRHPLYARSPGLLLVSTIAGHAFVCWAYYEMWKGTEWANIHDAANLFTRQRDQFCIYIVMATVAHPAWKTAVEKTMPLRRVPRRMRLGVSGDELGPTFIQ